MEEFERPRSQSRRPSWALVFGTLAQVDVGANRSGQRQAPACACALRRPLCPLSCCGAGSITWPRRAVFWYRPWTRCCRVSRSLHTCLLRLQSSRFRAAMVRTAVKVVQVQSVLSKDVAAHHGICKSAFILALTCSMTSVLTAAFFLARRIFQSRDFT